MWKKILVVLTLVHAVLGASTGELETTSFEFLEKYTQKQYRTIVSLKISNANINKIDPKLKYLKNLESLDLSQNNVQISTIPQLNNLKVLKLNVNNLKSINVTALPPNLEVLDVSNNLLTQIPKDWRSLRSLKIFNIQKNPIDCDCTNVMTYDRIIKSGILISDVICHTPKKYLGKDIGAVNCSLGDIMLYDEPDEGSGAPDVFEDNLTEVHKDVPFVQEEEEQESNTFIDDKQPDELLDVQTTEATIVQPEEGSGDEGSGTDIALPESGVLGCIENCSTPGPVDANDEEHASPLPGLFDQIKILIDDLNFAKNFEEPTSTSTVAVENISLPTIATTTERQSAKEPRIYKEKETLLTKTADKNENVEVVRSDNATDGKLERASAAPQNSPAVYAVIGILAFLGVLFLICFIKKRRNGQRSKNRRGDLAPLGEELKPLSKPPIQIVNDKPVKNTQNNIPENIPLINGQKAAPKTDSPVLKSYTPLEHPERHSDIKEDEEELNVDPTLEQNGHTTIPDDVELRPKYPPELQTPQRERVTIRESEIPDSIPKTPLLVHRQKNSEGEIVTTVVP